MEVQDVKHGVWSSGSGLQSGKKSESNRSFASMLQENYANAELNEVSGPEKSAASSIGQAENKKNVCDLLASEATSISIQDIWARLDNMIDAFQEQITNLFGQHGVDTSREIELECDAYGNVKVANDHPDKEKIEKIFQDNPDLANLYHGISATQSLLSACEEASEFQRMYADNPELAVQTYSYLFDDNRDTSDRFTIKIVDGQVAVV